MIELASGNILKAEAEALVNTVNCVGVMGKGIALQFKQAWPENFRAYERACRNKEVQLGSVFTFETGRLMNPRYIINFPTKQHWRAKSRLKDIQAGLESLREEIKRLSIHSIAIPPLGCGSGGLQWSKVEPSIRKALKHLPNVRVMLFAPEGAPAAETMPVATRAPRLTRARAMLIRLFESYAAAGYRLSRLEVQKLAYFLQAAGEEMNLRFAGKNYGPYAEELNHVLQRLEGHFIRGYGDRSREVRIRLLPTAAEAARDAVAGIPEADQRLERVSRLIRGFETPYGMELLATIHWVANTQMDAAVDADAAIVGVYSWSPRKRATFRPDHIRKAWTRLHSEGWLGQSNTRASSSPS